MYNAIAILDISMEIRFNMCAFITNFRHDHALPGWQEIESDSFKNDVREVSSKKRCRFSCYIWLRNIACMQLTASPEEWCQAGKVLRGYEKPQMKRDKVVPSQKQLLIYLQLRRVWFRMRSFYLKDCDSVARRTEVK